MNARCLTIAAALLSAALTCACGSTKPSRFYSLSVVQEPSSPALAAEGPRVRLTTVELAEHLKSAKIVSRQGPNQVRFAEYDRWAANLQALFSSTLAANLAHMLPSENVVQFPWEPLDGDVYRVHVSVSRFEAHDDQAILVARWGVTTPVGEVARMHQTRCSQPLERGADQADVVFALSACLGQLSRELSQAILAEQEPR